MSAVATTPDARALLETFGPVPESLDVSRFVPPTFDDLESERQHRKEQLAAALRVFGWLGFSEGVAGHVTARDPEFTDCFWVNPFGMSFNRITVSSLILVDNRGEVVHGNQPVNRAAFCIHSQVHTARPDVVAAAHAHSLHGKAFSSLGIRLDPITQDACPFFEDQGLYDGYGGIASEIEEGRRIGAALGPHKAVILQNHGLLTVGQTVAEAAWWFVTMERSCQAQLLAMAAGRPVSIDRETALAVRAQAGTPTAGWIQFQPLWDQIVASAPDLFT